MTSRPAADHDAVKRALGALAAGIPFPAWRGGEGAPTYPQVVALWLDACARRGVSGDALYRAAQDWLDRPIASSTGRRDWPAPYDVLDLVTRTATVDALIPGCGRCSAEGYRTVALHREDAAGIPAVCERQVHCDCQRGRTMAQRKGQPVKGSDEPGRVGVLLVDYLGTERNRAGYLAAYVDPTPEQRETAATWARLGVTRRPWGEVAAIVANMDRDDRARPESDERRTRRLRDEADRAATARTGELPPSDPRETWAADGDNPMEPE